MIGALQFTLVGDPVFGVIWWTWAILWLLFFLLVGRYETNTVLAVLVAAAAALGVAFVLGRRGIPHGTASSREGAAASPA